MAENHHEDHGWMQSALDNGRLILEAGREYHITEMLVVPPGAVIEIDGAGDVKLTYIGEPEQWSVYPDDFLPRDQASETTGNAHD